MVKVSRAIGVWTHYYDPDVILKRDDLKDRFDSAARVQHIGGRGILSYKQRYLNALKSKGFCGGSAPTSYWLTKESSLGVLSDFGFQVVIGQDCKDHPNGPALTFFASR
jgi:hypothetical protein